jgi:hypothetical protein
MSDIKDYVETTEGMFINSNMDEFAKYKMARSRSVREKQMLQKIDYLEKELVKIKKVLYDIHSRIQ